MLKPVHIGHSYIGERELFSLSLPDFQSLPDSIPLPSKHFIAFLAADAVGIDAEILAKFSRKLLNAGCVYFCAWGPDCERMHDIFDGECLYTQPVIMTTWHSKESLDEALWFFIYSTYPDDGYLAVTGSSLAISVGNSDWDARIRRRLAELDTLDKDVC